jgi:hypothetical protein
MWEVDMHFAGIYVTGRWAGADHQTALRVALASQMLDDYSDLAAPSLKIRATYDIISPTPKTFEGFTSAIRYTQANAAHALGISINEALTVARHGIATKDEFVFGIGLHTVVDLRSHRNLSGWLTWGHGLQLNEDYTISWPWSTSADKTNHNPREAWETLSDYYELWGEFLNTKPPELSKKQKETLRHFIETEGLKGKTIVLLRTGIREIPCVIGLMSNQQQRKSLVEAMPQREQALKTTMPIWLRQGSPTLFRTVLNLTLIGDLNSLRAAMS